MNGTVKSLLTTLRLAFRHPVTLQYPTEAPPLAPRFMAHPVLTWDAEVVEPYCTGCLVCARVCPTDCITVSMKDNPKSAAGESHRRKIVDVFELNVADCIMCGLCVEYCNFDAILMSDHFDFSQASRTNLVLGLGQLLEMGREQEAKGRWHPPTTKKAQRRAAAQAVSIRLATAAAVEERAEESTAVAAPVDERVAAARARAAEIRAQRARERGEAPPVTPAVEAPATPEEQAPRPVDPRVAEARARAAEIRAQRARERGEAPPETPAAEAPATPEEQAPRPVDPRVAEARARAAEIRAQRARERGEAPAQKEEEDAPKESEETSS